MKLFRFTFIHGSYDIGQAVVVADSWEEAEKKLRRHCEVAHPEQGREGKERWLYETIERRPETGLAPLEINDEVALTYGVDG